MKILAGLGILGLTLSVGHAALTAPSATPARWSRIAHEPLFRTVTPVVSDATVFVTSSPDVVVGIRGATAY